MTNFYNLPLQGSHVPARYDLFPANTAAYLLKRVPLTVYDYFDESASTILDRVICKVLVASNGFYHGKEPVCLEAIFRSISEAIVGVQSLMSHPDSSVLSNDSAELLSEELMSQRSGVQEDVYKPTGQILMPQGFAIISEVLDYGQKKGYPEANMIPDEPVHRVWYAKHHLNHALAHLMSHKSNIMVGNTNHEENDLTHTLCRLMFAIASFLDIRDDAVDF